MTSERTSHLGSLQGLSLPVYYEPDVGPEHNVTSHARASQIGADERWYLLQLGAMS
jgi:hypothetical protein